MIPASGRKLSALLALFMPGWRHKMETFSALLALCARNSPITGEFPAQRAVTRSFDISLIFAWINDWVNNREVGDSRPHRAHYDVIVMSVVSQHKGPVSTGIVLSMLFARLKIHLRPSDAYMRQYITPTLCQIMACRLGTNPSSERMLPYCQIDHKEHFSVKLFKIQKFSFKDMPLKIASAKWGPVCLGLNVLITLVLSVFVWTNNFLDWCLQNTGHFYNVIHVFFPFVSWLINNMISTQKQHTKCTSCRHYCYLAFNRLWPSDANDIPSH